MSTQLNIHPARYVDDLEHADIKVRFCDKPDLRLITLDLTYESGDGVDRTKVIAFVDMFNADQIRRLATSLAKASDDAFAYANRLKEKGD